jgi:putative hydrolase of the HAD superfamily
VVAAAVLFDYFGTLTQLPSAAQRRRGSHEVANLLGVDGDLFYTVLTSTFTERATATIGDLEATMRWVAQRCEGDPSDEQLRAACARRLELESGYATQLRPEALDVLRWLTSAGVPVGVVSDCTHELDLVWERLPVAALVGTAALSVRIGCRKPHPAMYWHACRGLGVDPTEVLYVGDGGSNELSGATALGMTVVRVTGAEQGDALVYDLEVAWDGPVISSLTELAHHQALSGIGLVGRSRALPT